ncbi:hypothetical protein CQW23_25609 [Capsicum baccatum]|uniref:Peptidase A1 domain-containing protein n=1 Tax=Capsicum baccatum TaxID=33114 RepID=A0A2G2VLH0_CAPBA|nr:hypothetical protein CQW23_25609 [Capsicum baccatum]
MALLLLVFLSLISTATSAGVFLPLERKFNTDEVEMRELRARDRIRHGRMLQQQSGVVDFPLQGSSISGIYYTRIRLGSSPKEFRVQIDTGSDVLWVSCISCKGCPTHGGIDQVRILLLFLRIFVSSFSFLSVGNLGRLSLQFDVEAFEDWSLDAPSMEDKSDKGNFGGFVLDVLFIEREKKTNEKEKRNGVGANTINSRICDVCSRAASKGMLSWQARSDTILSKVMTSCDLWFNFESDTETWGKICPCEGTENFRSLCVLIVELRIWYRYIGAFIERSLMEDQILKYVAKSIHGVQESISSDLSEIRKLVQELSGQVISSGAQNLVPDMSGGPALAPRTLRHKPSRVELDHFHGVNPEAWIFKAERYFELNGIADTHKLSVTSIYLDGDALKWFR